MGDTVDELREWAQYHQDRTTGRVLDQAATEIERLRVKLAERQALIDAYATAYHHPDDYGFGAAQDALLANATIGADDIVERLDALAHADAADAADEIERLRTQVDELRTALKTAYREPDRPQGERYAVVHHSRWLETEEPKATVIRSTDGWRWHDVCTCDPENAIEIAEALATTTGSATPRKQTHAHPR